ncbi:MAG: hypothetical protein ACD_58C00027G0001 [uncultured bacterium]|nr:MAG: hypothetical protein ACD_58C00027G0001 [uncultured bacterium]
MPQTANQTVANNSISRSNTSINSIISAPILRSPAIQSQPIKSTTVASAQDQRKQLETTINRIVQLRAPSTNMSNSQQPAISLAPVKSSRPTTSNTNVSNSSLPSVNSVTSIIRGNVPSISKNVVELGYAVGNVVVDLVEEYTYQKYQEFLAWQAQNEEEYCNRLEEQADLYGTSPEIQDLIYSGAFMSGGLQNVSQIPKIASSASKIKNLDELKLLVKKWTGSTDVIPSIVSRSTRAKQLSSLLSKVNWSGLTSETQQGLHKVVKSVNSGYPNIRKGAEFQLKRILEIGPENIKAVELVEDGVGRFDAVLKDGTIVEFKNWPGWRSYSDDTILQSTDRLIKQLRAYTTTNKKVVIEFANEIPSWAEKAIKNELPQVEVKSLSF